MRDLLGHPASPVVALILARVLPALREVPGEARLFFEALTRLAPVVATVRGLARHLKITPSTLMSRFYRAGLPSPKSYLAGARLLHAAYLFQNPGLSVADVAYRLDYSSPQSFGRHVRTVMKMSPVVFRSTYDGQGMLQYFRTELILPYVDILCGFRPSAAYPGWIPKPQSGESSRCRERQ